MRSVPEDICTAGAASSGRCVMLGDGVCVHTCVHVCVHACMAHTYVCPWNSIYNT